MPWQYFTIGQGIVYLQKEGREKKPDLVWIGNYLLTNKVRARGIKVSKGRRPVEGKISEVYFKSLTLVDSKHVNKLEYNPTQPIH